MLCPKHGVEMVRVGEAKKYHFKSPLHRCPACTDYFRAEFAKAMSSPHRGGRPCRQHVLPPVIMSERWPL